MRAERVSQAEESYVDVIAEAARIFRRPNMPTTVARMESTAATFAMLGKLGLRIRLRKRLKAEYASTLRQILNRGNVAVIRVLVERPKSKHGSLQLTQITIEEIERGRTQTRQAPSQPSSKARSAEFIIEVDSQSALQQTLEGNAWSTAS